MEHLFKYKKFDLTIVCESGGIDDLHWQLKSMGQDGMILAFIEKQYLDQDELTRRAVE